MIENMYGKKERERESDKGIEGEREREGYKKK